MFIRRTGEEDGATLVIVLTLISVFGLIVAGLLTEAAVSVKYTNVVTSHQAKVYAADAGVSAGIQQVRQHNSLCPAPGVTGTIVVSTPPEPKVPAVTVSCTGTVGSALGARGYAIMVRNSTTGVAGVLNTQSGSSSPKKVSGPVFVEGSLNLLAPLHVLRGDLAHKGSCQPAGNFDVVDDGYDYYCPATAPPLPDHHSPTTVPTPEAALSTPTPSTTPPGCSIFRPGHYTAKPELQDGNNYFTSGFYYFNFDDPIVVDAGKHVWAGRPHPTETPTPSPGMPARPPCAVDSGQPSDPAVAGSSGWGVVFAFGKTARLSTSGTGNADQGHIEIFARRDPTGLSGTNGLSIIAVPPPSTAPPATNNWAPVCPVGVTVDCWTKSIAGTRLLSVGNHSTLAIHGLVYARDQTLALWANNGVTTQVLGGVVANRLEVQSTPGDGVGVSVVGDNPDPRYVTIKAIVSTPGGKDVESTAVIRLDNEIAILPIIESWRTRGIVDPT